MKTWLMMHGYAMYVWPAYSFALGAIFFASVTGVCRLRKTKKLIINGIINE